MDEQISYIVAEQVRAKRPDIPIESLSRWREGAFLATEDSRIRAAAGEEGRTLVTYDLSTIAPVLVEWGQQAGRAHAGVVFIDGRTLASSDFGGLVRADLSLGSAPCGGLEQPGGLHAVRALMPADP